MLELTLLFYIAGAVTDKRGSLEGLRWACYFMAAIMGIMTVMNIIQSLIVGMEIITDAMEYFEK